jgi:HK97 family phage portal protein
VLGDALKYEAMTIPAQQAQLIEQLEWTARDIAACFHMPLFKVGGPVPANHTIEALNLQYYSDCLQSLIEQFELCLDEGLRLPAGYSVELDTDQLARMDTAAQIEALNKSVAGGWMAPNEARKARNLRPVVGGDSPMIQQQNYSLAALAKRDAKEEPFA